MLSTVGDEGVLEPECLADLIMWLFKAEAQEPGLYQCVWQRRAAVTSLE